MAKVLSSIVHGVEQIKHKVRQTQKKVKDNYSHFKAGRKAEFDDQNKRTKKSNIDRLKSDW